MHSFLVYVELTLSYLFFSARGRDAKLFTRTPLFTDIPATIQINSPDIGESGSRMHLRHTQDAEDQFPELSWTAIADAAEYILVVEDPDAPLPFPGLHGLYYQIHGSVTSFSPADFEKGDNGTYSLKGGFKYAKNIRKTIYGGPRPLLNHGEHRYFYELVALNKPLTGLSEYPSKDEILKKLEQDKSVLAWGEWIGTYERRLD